MPRLDCYRLRCNEEGAMSMINARTRRDLIKAIRDRCLAGSVAEKREAEPCQTAKVLLQRLENEALGEFPSRQLRTLQRRIKAWRSALHPVNQHDDPGSASE